MPISPRRIAVTTFLPPGIPNDSGCPVGRRIGFDHEETARPHQGHPGGFPTS
jgi:hypothetical protein